MKNHLKSIGAIAAAALFLAGCGSDAAEETTPTPTTTPAAVELSDVAADEQETSKYERIVAVNSETADMALLLAGPDKVVAVAASSQSPHMGQVPDLARQVDNTLPPGVEPDAEQILSYDPDLVLITARHGAEDSVSDQLESTGVETISFDGSQFDTPEAYAAALRELGAALGLEHKADALAAELESDIAILDEKRDDSSPSFVALMARGPSIMAMGENNALPGLAVRAGATNAAAAIGLTTTGPIDAEQLLKANPEIIFVEDFNGSGLEPFQEMLDNPALADVEAIKNDRLVLVPMNEASALAGLNMPTGYEKILTEVQK